MKHAIEPDYITGPSVTTVRVYSEEGEWFLDGIDATGRFTESCWSFDTMAGAVNAVDEWRAAFDVPAGAELHIVNASRKEVVPPEST